MPDENNSWDAGFAEVDRVLKYLPHRYPILMIDRIVEFDPGKSLVAVKNLSFNEPCLQGHFPGRPVMPGVLMVEAIAQAAAVMGFLSMDLTPETHTFLLAGVDGARFRRPVVPGDRLVVHAAITRKVRNIIKVDGRIEVDGQVACSASLTTALVRQGNG